MDEASKTNQLRGADFAPRYLQGRVLDIGAGKDAVCSWAEVFDQQHGDANRIGNYFPTQSFDAVHSSHCLEHMHQPAQALAGWWSLVKPGGYLILVVPDEDLYEQGIWPSFFNADHKATFRLDRATSWSAVSHELRSLCHSLPGAEVISAEVQAQGYDHSLNFLGKTNPKRVGYPKKWWLKIARKIPVVGADWRLNLLRRWVPMGYPMDQTHGAALAQIQIILRRS